MVNPKLRKALLTKLKVTPQRISQRTKALKAKVPMSTEDGWYVLAAMEELDISRLLDEKQVDRTRELLKHFQEPELAATPRRAVKAKVIARPNRVNIAPSISASDPLLSRTVLEEAKMMAEKVYPLAYVLENSMRAFVSRILAGEHGDDWWGVCVPRRIVEAVSGRMTAEERDHWHGKRGAHPIYYADTEHLRRIVEANWKAFEDFLPNKAFFIQRLTEINISRRVIAHNNPLSADDRKRLEVYFTDWQKHVAGIVASLP